MYRDGLGVTPACSDPSVVAFAVGGELWSASIAEGLVRWGVWQAR